MFGDDNHERIDAQIRVLEERMSEDDVYVKIDGDPENPDRASDIWANAREAATWLAGQADEPPSDAWKELADRYR